VAREGFLKDKRGPGAKKFELHCCRINAMGRKKESQSKTKF